MSCIFTGRATRQNDRHIQLPTTKHKSNGKNIIKLKKTKQKGDLTSFH